MNVYGAAITLFLVMDPLGNIPLFLSVLERVPPSRRRRVILREMLIALAVLTVFLFFGQYILQGLHISEPALSIGGGVVLFLIALRMIFPRPVVVDDSADRSEEPLIVPLAVPLVAGPSAMATLILFSTQHPGQILDWTVALLVAWAVSLIVLLSGENLRRVLGRRGLAATERLMGMILTTLAIQMLLSGVELFVMSIGPV